MEVPRIGFSSKTQTPLKNIFLHEDKLLIDWLRYSFSEENENNEETFQNILPQ